MKINSLTLAKISQNNGYKTQQSYVTKPFAMDTFEKSNVSFKGANDNSEDILKRISDDFLKHLPTEFLKSLSEEMIENIVTGNFMGLPTDLLKDITDDDFYNLLDGLSKTIRDYSDMVEYERMERQLGYVLEAYSDKKIRETLKRSRGQKIEDHLAIVLKSHSQDDREFMITLFKSSGFNSVLNLENFAYIYSRNPKPFRGQSIEAVEIYGILKNKDDLSRYGELLLYLFNEEYAKDKADYEVLNRTTAFLKQMGLNDFEKFDEKFAHLKSKFNNFEDISDRAEAIEYLETTYESKTQLLDEILKVNPALKSQSAEKLYTSINDIVDYFYEKNGQKSLSGLSDIIEYVAFSNKLKPIGMKQLADNFDRFETAEDKVDFYLFLKDCDISISDYNALVGKNIVSDIDPLLFFMNKEKLTEHISQIKGTNQTDSFDLYRKFRDIINAVYDEKSTNTNEIKTLINMIDVFKLKDSSSLLEFYNKASGVKKKSITSEEIKEFIDLFQYLDSPKLLDDARKLNTTAIELLSQEKDKFLAVKNDIENFMITDKKSYFAGQTPLSIFKNYREAITENSTDINTVLQNIVNFNIAGEEEYKLKAVHIEKFATFFENREALMNFFSHNNITFDGSKEDNERIENCFVIFNSLYDEEHKEESKQRIDYFAQSGFIPKSEKKLTDFLSKMPSDKTKRIVLSVIADKKIPSLVQMEKFFKQYQTTNTTGKDLIQYIRNLPQNINFEESVSTLGHIQSKINQYNLPVNITGDNIVSIDITKHKNPSKVSTADMVSVLNNIYNAPEGQNFLSVIANNTEPSDDMINAYRIAKEIATRIDKSSESYQNIARLLHIDRKSLKLEENCSSYIYARAIQEVLPKEFVDFVKSDEWLKYSDDDETIPNLTFHAKLRAIDRFALDEVEDIKELYTQETKEKLKALIKTVYTSCPTEINGNGSDKRIVVDFNHNNKEIETVFSQDGKMLTIVPRRTSKTA